MTERRGRYIVWEGSDGVGKSTVKGMAVAESERRGIPTLSVFEPGYTNVGRYIRRVLLDPETGHLSPVTEQMLFLADRSHLASEVIEPAIAQGIDVHTDRNWWSGVAYQSIGGGMDLQKIIDLTGIVMPSWYIQPDVGLVLYIDQEERTARKLAAAAQAGISLDRMEQKGDEFFEKVASAYSNIVIGQLGATGIDASGSPEEVFARTLPYLFPED